MRLRFEELGDLARVLLVTLDAQAQRFEPLEEQPRVERRERRAEVAQQLHARLEDVREIPEDGT